MKKKSEVTTNGKPHTREMHNGKPPTGIVGESKEKRTVPAANTPGSNQTESYSRLLLQMAICVTGIYVSFGFWSVKQERIITKPYEIVQTVDGKSTVVSAKLSTVFVLGLAQVVMAVVISGLLLLVENFVYNGVNAQSPTGAANGKARSDKNKPASGDGSTRRATSSVVLIGFTNAFASMLGFAAMRRLPYPVVLATKMSKMVPVILVGFFWHGTRYSLNKCLACALITGGSFFFYMLGEADDDAAPRAKARSRSEAVNWLGFVLLFFNLLADGFTNSTQDKLVKMHGWTGNKLMFVTNLSTAVWLSVVLLLMECLHPVAAVYLRTSQPTALPSFLAPISPLLYRFDTSFRWFLSDVAPLQDFSKTMNFFHRYPDALHDVAIMSLLNAAGQMFIFRTISLFGSLTVTALTLLRKSASVVLSIIVHGHSVTPEQWFSLSIVFIGAVWEGLIHARKSPAAKK